MKVSRFVPYTPGGLSFVIRALKYRNYRLFFSGQAISLIGTWMQRIALAWLVYRLTNSKFLLGMVEFTGQMPAFLLTPLAGVVADRWNRHRLLIVTQAIAMLQALILAALVLSNTIQIWHIFGLSFFLGLINAFDVPIRQSFVVEMVDNREDLVNAIALNSTLFNSARLIGPTVAGILISIVGEGLCFLLNGLSFSAVLIALHLMRVKPRSIEIPQITVLKRIREGFTYAYHFKPIRWILLLLALISLMGLPYAVLMPVFARDIFRGDAHILGFLMGAVGVGAVGASLYLAARKSVAGLETIIAFAPFSTGLSLILFAFSRTLWLSMILLIIVGFSNLVHIASSNTVLQTIVDENKRGRVMSFYTMALLGMAPFSSFIAGSLASLVGAPATLAIGGLACCSGSLLFIHRLPALRKMIHPVYCRMGIISRE